MTAVEQVARVWFTILDASAEAAAALAPRLWARHRIRVVEEGDHELVLYPEGRTAAPPLGRLVLPESGVPASASRLLRRSHVTLELDPGRFIFRSIDLPGRAAEFIEAIVRTQVDRLTPWRPDQAVFGWSQPVPKQDQDGITLTVAATDKAHVTPLIERVRQAGAAVIVARVALPAGLEACRSGMGQSFVVAHATTAAFAVAFWRRWLGLASAAVVTLVIGSSLYGQLGAMHLTAAADELDRMAATTRSRLAAAAGDADPLARGRRIVEQRKAETPFATLALDAVSGILPDDSYVTSFEIDGTRLRLIGYTSDAPALIRVLEASDMVRDARFFAPTTRLPEDPGDRFNIEATLLPQAPAR